MQNGGKYMKKIRIILIVFIIIISLILTSCATNKEYSPDSDISLLVGDYEYDEAISKAEEKYEGKELEKAMDYILKSKKTHDNLIATVTDVQNKSLSPGQKLKIQDGWKWKKDGNYTYITGSVKNETEKDITYFKLTAEYKDSAGTTLDTNYTNSGETISPGAMKKFEIMHKYDADFKKVAIKVVEAKH